MFPSTLRRFLWILGSCAAGLNAFGQVGDSGGDGSLPVPEAAAEAGLTPEDWAGIQGAYEQGRSTNGVEDGSPQLGDPSTGQAMTSGPIVQQQAYLKASNTPFGVQYEAFGFSVSVSGDTVVVGAIGEDSNATGVNGDQHNNLAPRSGAAYVFVRNGTSWSQQAYLKASNTERWDSFGYSVSVSGDTVAVGAPVEASSAAGVNGNQSDNSSPGSGAAYIFVRDGTTWSQQAYLKASNTDKFDIFGRAVSVSGDTVAVGAYWEDSNAKGVNGNQTSNSSKNAGAVYVFVRSGTSWSQQAYLKASNTRLGDVFGWTVAVSGDTVVVGAPQEASNATGVNGDQSDNSFPLAGAAYVFVRSGTSWSQQAYLKSSNTSQEDFFGWSVAASGNTVVIAAAGEDSNATGVNGDQHNNSSPWAGAAYVFVRSGTGWSQQAYLKASNTGAYDVFGLALSVAGDTVVVGTYHEASNASGINGNQDSNSAPGAGAAYMFVRSGTTWSHQAYLKASNTNGEDLFGGSVSVSGDTVVVGAVGEDSNAKGVNGDQGDNSGDRAGAAYVFATPAHFRYCTGKTTSAGCVPFVSFSGSPSVSSGSFNIVSKDHIEGEPGIYLYSVMKTNLDFHAGKLCVKAPFHRLTTLIKATDGLACTGCAGNCRMFKRDFNELIQSGSNPALTVGQQVYVQVRQSDPSDPTGFGDNLSDALTFAIGL